MARNIALAESGMLAVTGNFDGEIDLGFGALTSRGGQDIFIATYSKGGHLRWSASFGGAGKDDYAAVALDAQGDIYLLASFEQTVDFGPDARYGDVREFAAALAPYGPPRDDPAQAAVAVELLSVGEGASSAARKRRIFALVAAAAIAIAAAAIFVVASKPAPPTVEPAPSPRSSAETAPSAPLSPLPSQQAAPRRKPSAEPAPSAASTPKPTSNANDPPYL